MKVFMNECFTRRKRNIQLVDIAWKTKKRLGFLPDVLQSISKTFAFLNRCSLRWYEPNQVQRVSVYRTQSQLAITSPPTFFRYELFVDYYTHS